VDQEGGRVARLKEPWTVWPAARAVGRTGSAATAREMGQALAEELRACGIRYDFAPCVDVDTNPRNPVIGDRSFGDDPDLVARLGAAMIEGLQQGGVAASAKHFPGHGDTDVDSHLDLPSVDHSRARLDEIELRPFRAAIAAGVASVMTSHVLVREIDDARPATLSPAVITGLLRQELGYTGVVVTDDLEMQALAKHWRPAQIAVLGAQAAATSSSFARARRAGGSDRGARAGVRVGRDRLQGAGGGRGTGAGAQGAFPRRLRGSRSEAGPPRGGGWPPRALAEEIATRSGIRPDVVPKPRALRPGD
jgi:beta-N-acetylhexosaminidase